LFAKKSTRTRRIAARVALAGAIAVVPMAAVAVPAFAATPGSNVPSATAIDWNDRDHGGPGDDHRGPDCGPRDDHRRPDCGPRDDRDDHRGPGPDQPPAADPQQFLPPTGSFGG
jgi:hypothetical protein